MKIEVVVVLVTLALIPIFCQAQVGEEQKALDSFKLLVRHHVDSYNPYGHEHVLKVDSTKWTEGGWIKERFTIDSVKFDVEKTASLVSPLVGTLTFRLLRGASAFHPTQDDAAADTTFVDQSVWVHKHVFGYQDHQWQPTSRQHRLVGSSLDGYYPCVSPSGKDSFGCLEEFDGHK